MIVVYMVFIINIIEQSHACIHQAEHLIAVFKENPVNSHEHIFRVIFHESPEYIFFGIVFHIAWFIVEIKITIPLGIYSVTVHGAIRPRIKFSDIRAFLGIGYDPPGDSEQQVVEFSGVPANQMPDRPFPTHVFLFGQYIPVLRFIFDVSYPFIIIFESPAGYYRKGFIF